MKRRSNVPLVWGLTLGAAVALYVLWRTVRDDEDEVRDLDPETVRTIAAGALLADPQLRRYGLDVRAIGPGILDVSGTVDSAEIAARALETVRRGPGVRTVLDRIHVDGAGASPRISAVDG